jgi:hypothetical protein
LSLKGLLQYSVAFGLTIHYSRSSWLRQSHCFRLEMSFLLRNTEGFSPMLILAFLGVRLFTYAYSCFPWRCLRLCERQKGFLSPVRFTHSSR